MSTSSTGSASSNYTGPTRMTGLVSGFDTTSIVEQLMALERQPLQNLDIKKQTEELRLQAYQAVNTYVLKFKNSIASLSSSKLWNGKSAASSNEKSLTATASEYAVNGSYSFKVAQLAAVTQYMSKGFASSKSPLVKQEKIGDEEPVPYKLGEINLSSAKTRVDNSAKLEELNGGKGVFRGSVRITDGKGTTSTIDLSGCDTVDDVVRTLNGSSGAQINAEIKDGTIHITDASGVDPADAKVKVQNVGTGTTASDLGIAGTSEGTTGVIKGRNVYTMGRDTSLELLNDGLGIEEGIFRLVVTDAEGYSLNADINVDDCETVGDVIDRANSEFKRLIEQGGHDPKGLMDYSKLEGLTFGVSADGLSMSLTGTKANYSYTFIDPTPEGTVANTYPEVGLGLNGTKTANGPDEELVFDRIFGGMNSPMLKNLNGTAGAGIGASDDDSRLLLPVDLNDSTPLSALNNGNKFEPSLPFLQIVTHEGGPEISDYDKDNKIVYHHNIITPQAYQDFLDDFDPTDPDVPTVGDFKKFVNDSIQKYASNPDNNAAALNGLRFDYDSEGVKRFSVYGAQGGYSYEIGGTFAGALGVGRSDTNQTMVEKYLDKESADYDAYKKGLEDFYNIGKTSVLPDNVSFDEETTMADMLGQMHGLKKEDFASTDAYNAAVASWKADAKADPAGTLATLFGQNLEFTTGYRKADGTTDSTTISVDVRSLFDTNNPLDGDLTVDKFIEIVNDGIAAAFTGFTDPNTGEAISLLPPKLAIGAAADNLQWTNMDFSNGWQISGGDGFERMHLNKDTTVANDAGALTFAEQGEHALTGDLDVFQRGYIQYRDVTADNADTVFIGELNHGLGLAFGKADDKLEFTINEQTFSFTYAELAAEMAGTNSGQGGELKYVTVQDYVDSLNTLIQGKLSDINAGISDADKHLDFKISVGTNKLEITDIKNITDFQMSGELAQDVRTGLTAGTQKVGELTSFPVGTLVAGVHVFEAPKDLGTIKMSLGSGLDLELNTTGLTQDSTLSELIASFNDQLDEAAKVAGGEEWANIRFTLNESGTGIAVDNSSSMRLTFHDTQAPMKNLKGEAIVDENNEPVLHTDGNYLAQDLGLIKDGEDKNRIDPYSFYNASTLNRSMISRATKLDEYYSSTKEKGSITIGNSHGKTRTINLEGIKSIGDLIDIVNNEAGYYLNVFAKINEAGDGIMFYEDYTGQVKPEYGEGGPVAVSVSDVDGGTFAKSLGIAGSGKGDPDKEGFHRGSLNTTIEVMSSDTLESIMYRIAASGNYKCAVVNNGQKLNPHRLSISSAETGEANDFVIQTDIELFGFTQTSRAKDGKVLYGDPNSTASPVMLSSSTNTNSTAILGLTLDLKQASSEWTTITVSPDKEKVKEEITAMVESYNELTGIISMLDGYDAETGEPGILFGDTSVRTLMDDINEFFYAIYNPNNVRIGSLDEDGNQATWSWMDLGVSLDAQQSNADGTGGWFSTMALDEDALDTMLSEHWDVLSVMLSSQRNVSDSNLAENVRPSASFNGDLEDGFVVENAINGDTSSGSWGAANGIQAKGTIADGNDEYTIYFQQPVTITRMSIFHQSADTALKDFTVEYLDANTGKWETREIEGNSSDANHLGFALPPTVQAIRIKADSTNAKDDKFRLLDIQVFEETGLAGKLNKHTTTLGDSQIGFLRERNDAVQATITDIKEQMERLQERLDQKEEALWRKFTAMETALGKMNNQGDYFNQMMGKTSEK